MVSRTKISKEIRRRTGGDSQETGKGTSVEEINRDRHMWEMVPGTGTSPYNPPKWKKKKRASYTEEDLGQVGTLKNIAKRKELRRIEAEKVKAEKAKNAAKRKELLENEQTGTAILGTGKRKGGKVSRYKGGKVGHNGTKFVSNLYD